MKKIMTSLTLTLTFLSSYANAFELGVSSVTCSKEGSRDQIEFEYFVDLPLAGINRNIHSTVQKPYTFPATNFRTGHSTFDPKFRYIIQRGLMTLTKSDGSKHVIPVIARSQCGGLRGAKEVDFVTNASLGDINVFSHNGTFSEERFKIIKVVDKLYHSHQNQREFNCNVRTGAAYTSTHSNDENLMISDRYSRGHELSGYSCVSNHAYSGVSFDDLERIMTEVNSRYNHITDSVDLGYSYDRTNILEYLMSKYEVEELAVAPKNYTGILMDVFKNIKNH